LTLDRAQAPYVPKHIAVHLQYGKELELRLSLPPRLNDTARPIVAPIENRAINDCKDLLRRIRQLEQQGRPVQIYPDAEEYIQQRLFQENIEAKVAAIRANPGAHPLRKELLKTELLPYQLDGIAFAAGRGRAILAARSHAQKRSASECVDDSVEVDGDQFVALGVGQLLELPFHALEERSFRTGVNPHRCQTLQQPAKGLAFCCRSGDVRLLQQALAQRMRRRRDDVNLRGNSLQLEQVQLAQERGSRTRPASLPARANCCSPRSPEALPLPICRPA